MNKFIRTLLLTCLGFAQITANAAIPKDFSLQDLKEYHQTKNTCQNECNSISKIKFVSLSQNILKVDIEVNAIDLSYLDIPFNFNLFKIKDVKLNNQDKVATLYDGRNFGLIVNKGISNIELTIDINEQNNIQFKSKPSYSLESLDDNISINTIGNQIVNFKKKEEVKNIKSEDSKFEVKKNPIYLVKRTISLENKWQVNTEVVSLTPWIKSNDKIKVKLLPNEKILDNNIEVLDNSVELIVNENSISWNSIIPINKEIKIENTTDIIQDYVIKSNREWVYSYTGLNQNNLGNTIPGVKKTTEWLLYKGDVVNLKLDNPKAIDGLTSVIKEYSVRIYNTYPITYAYNYNYETSLGGRYYVDIPKNYEFKSLRIDNIEVQNTLHDNKLAVDAKPGVSNVEIEVTSKDKIEWLYKIDDLKFNEHIINKTYELHDYKGWVLATGGADIKPSILLWGIILVVLFTSIGLGFIENKFKSRDWFFILLGLSQLGMFAFYIMVAWYLMVSKKELINNKIKYYNTIQSIILIFTLVMIVTVLMSFNQGLLETPNSYIEGFSTSSTNIYWYSEVVATPWLFIVPEYIYRIIMLCWAFWVSIKIIKLLSYGWNKIANPEIWKNNK